jgi:hypothetical protein
MRRKRRSWLILVPALALGCRLDLVPEPKPMPAPVVDPDPPAQDAGCEPACANLERLGGCDALPKAMTCLAACERLNGQLDANGKRIRALDTGCLAAAPDCAAVSRCD